MTWEVITFGNGQLIVNILNGLKLLMQGPWNSLMMLVALGAVALAVFRLAFPDKNDFNPVAGFVRTLAIIMVVFAVTMRITVNVGVTDVLNPTSPQEVVTGVPIAVAFPMYVQSTVSYELTTMVEAAFSLPAGASVQYGLMRHHLELQGLLNAQLPVGDTRATLTAYMLECIFPNVSDPTGLLDQNTLMDTPDLLGHLQVNEQVRGANIFQGGKLVDNITCADAYNNSPGKDVMSLLGSTTPLPDYKHVLQEVTMSFGADDTDGMVAELDQVVYSLLGVTGGGAGLSTLNTILLRDIWNAAVAEEANKDQNVVTAVNNMLDVLRREMSFQSYAVAWTISKWVPMLRAIGEGLVYMTAPLVLLMIMSRAGMATLGTYVKAFVWLALWGPLFAILNDIMYLHAAEKLHLLTLCPTDMPAWVQTRISAIAAGSPQCTGITLRNYDQIRDTILAINTAGLGLVNAVPFLAGALVYMGGNLASSALEHTGQPDTGGLAKTTAAGKLESVQYEGGGQLVTWAQETNLTRTADYRTGITTDRAPDGRQIVRDPVQGDRVYDGQGRMVHGDYREKLADGTARTTRANGYAHEITEQGRDPSGKYSALVTTHQNALTGKVSSREASWVNPTTGMAYEGHSSGDKGPWSVTGRGNVDGKEVMEHLTYSATGELIGGRGERHGTGRITLANGEGGQPEQVWADVTEQYGYGPDGREHAVRSGLRFVSPDGTMSRQYEAQKNADGTYTMASGQEQRGIDVSTIVAKTENGTTTLAARKGTMDPATGKIVTANDDSAQSWSKPVTARTQQGGHWFTMVGLANGPEIGGRHIGQFSGVAINERTGQVYGASGTATSGGKGPTQFSNLDLAKDAMAQETLTMVAPDGSMISGRGKRMFTPGGVITTFGPDALLATKEGQRYQVGSVAFANGDLINRAGQGGTDLSQNNKQRDEGVFYLPGTDKNGKSATVPVAGTRWSDPKTGETVLTEGKSGSNIEQVARLGYDITESTPEAQRFLGGVQLLPGTTVKKKGDNGIEVVGSFIMPVNEIQDDQTMKTSMVRGTGTLYGIGGFGINNDSPVRWLSGEVKSQIAGDGVSVEGSKRYIMDPRTGNVVLEKNESGKDRQQYWDSLRVKTGAEGDGFASAAVRAGVIEEELARGKSYERAKENAERTALGTSSIMNATKDGVKIWSRWTAKTGEGAAPKAGPGEQPVRQGTVVRGQGPTLKSPNPPTPKIKEPEIEEPRIDPN